jgi:hemoglobin/transferrin/lactoferrin receptor protein
MLCLAQKDTIKKKNKEFEPLVISGSKFSEKKKNVAQKIDIIGLKELRKLNTQTTADVLTLSGKVFVQKSQQGGGSPVIRGFEASRVLLMIDGVRLNNAIYRSGHLQNVITVDNNMLNRVEILSGPASTLYGSDALGGVVMMQTKNPTLVPFSKNFKLTTVNALTRFATANKEKTISAGVGFGNKNWGSLTNISISDFDDLRQGKWDPNNQLATWGREFYVDRINGMDSIVKTNNNLNQKFSGYRQLDILQKITYVPELSTRRGMGNSKHSLNFQFSTTTDVPRYDRLTQTNENGLPIHSQWYYGPQRRNMIAYQYDYFGDKKLLNDFRVNLSYQAIEESRNTRRFQTDEIQKRVENINVPAINVAARKKIKRHEITYGADAQFNILNSSAVAENIITGSTSPTDTRYPDGDNNMNLVGAFAQHVFKFGNGKFVLNDGIRFNATTLRSTIDNNILNLPFTEINENNQALTGNIGLIYFPSKKWRVNVNASRGFRAPNIDDLGKVFDSFTGEMLVVPNQNLKPEYTNSADIGIEYRDKKYFFSAYAFYTQFQNAIVLDDFEFNGSDSLFYNGQLTKVFANQNKAKARLYGMGFEMKIKFSKSFSYSGNIAYTHGRFIESNRLIPLDHVPPIYGRVSVDYDKDKLSTSLFCLFNGAKKLKDYNPDGEDNLRFALADGTPSWYSINFRSNYQISKNFSAQLGIDNILDRNYRHFASGISASGRSLILSLRYQY